MGGCNCYRDLSRASRQGVQPGGSRSSQLGAGWDRFYARLCDQPVRSLLARWPLSRSTVTAVLAQRAFLALDRLAYQACHSVINLTSLPPRGRADVRGAASALGLLPSWGFLVVEGRQRQTLTDSFTCFHSVPSPHNFFTCP